jgi:hypothetical protein
MLTPAQEAALALLRTPASFAVIGVSAQPEKYGHEVFETLHSGGYTVYPINPKYTEIAGCRCYASLAELPAMPDAVVLALAPHVTEQITPKVIAAGARLVWLPPGCFTEAAVETCQASGVPVIYDVCPVGALRALQMLSAGGSALA